MLDTDFPRSDELSGAVAQGYIDVDGRVRSNVLHLPVRGVGDGGAYSTVADMQSFWSGLFAGDVVALEWVAEMVRPRSEAPDDGRRYGLGFWLHPSSDVVFLEGADAGISCRSVHDPATGVIYIGIRSAVLPTVKGFALYVPFQMLDIGSGDRILTMIGMVPHWVRLFLWPAHLRSEYGPPEFPMADGPALWQLPGALLLVAFFGLIALLMGVLMFGRGRDHS